MALLMISSSSSRDIDPDLVRNTYIMGDRDKRRYRENKRLLKKEGNRDRRHFLKRQLELSPEDVTTEDEFTFGRNSSATMNGWHRDRSRHQDEENSD
jgi:hypothetical protein